MDPKLQEVVDDIKKNAIEAITPEAVEKAVAQIKTELKENMPLRKELFGEEDPKTPDANEEREEQAIDLQTMVKAMRQRNFAVAKEISSKYATKTLSEGVSADGGYLIPTELRNDIVKNLTKYGVARRDSTVVNVTAAKLTLPSVGTVTATRTGEGVKKTASQPAFGAVNIVIKKIAAIIPLTDELIEDSPISLMSLMGDLGAQAVAKVEDTWAFKGLGAGEGIMQNTSVPVYTLPTGEDTYVEAVPADLLAGLGSMNEAYLVGAKWYMSFSLFVSLLGKNDSTGRSLINPAMGDMPASLFGFPIELVSVMPKTSDGSQPGTKFAIFGNMKAMYLADRQQLTIDTSNEATITDTDGSTAVNLWQEDKTAIRLVERLDFEVADPTAFVVFKTAAT